ncbi:MAG: DUF2306 domain-containing protein [Burkholderiaceae bacterium]
MEFTPLILVHAGAAGAALALGGVTFLMKKGTARHRLLGRGWVALMALVALSSFWIQTSGHWSWIHLLSVATLAGLARAIYAAAHGNIREHRGLMQKIYVGGLLVAGLFTLLPSRLLGHLVWQSVGLI